MKNEIDNIFILTCDYFRDMTQPIYRIKLGFHWQTTHAKYPHNVIHLHNIERWKSPPLQHQIGM